MGHTGQRRLVAHAFGQTQGILDGALLVDVAQVAAAPQRRPQAAVVNGNNGLEPGLRVLGEVQRLQPGGFHHGEHAVAPVLICFSV